MVINSHRPKITNRVIKLALTCDTLLSSQVTGAHHKPVLADGIWGRNLTLQIFDCEVKSAERTTFRFRILGLSHETGLIVRCSCGDPKHRGWPLTARKGGALRDMTVKVPNRNQRRSLLTATFFLLGSSMLPLGSRFAAWPLSPHMNSVGLTKRMISTPGATIYS